MLPTIHPAEAHAQRDRALLIDVRTPGEYRSVHAEGSLCLPLDTLDAAAVRAAGADGRPVHVLCASGARAELAVRRLRDAGLDGCAVVAGGTEAWAAQGLPVVRGRGVIALERQVRIGAGALVVTGVVLALTVHPYAIALSAFIGCGLVFAGVTGWCGMGLLLARMPWNRSGGASAPGCATAR